MSVNRTVELLNSDGGLPVNCRIYKGQLLPALSPVKKGGGVPAGGVFAYRSEYIDRFIIATKNYIYLSASGTQFSYLTSIKSDNPFSIEHIYKGKPCVVVIDGVNCTILYGNSFSMRELDVSISCGISHCGRLFGANGITVYWLDGDNFNSEGSLTLDSVRGEISDICELGEKLIFIRKYGLTVANMFGSPENFSVDITNTDTEEIYKNTARVADGKLLFWTSSGLCSFDGSVVKHIEHRCNYAVSVPEQAVVFADKYYLNCYCGVLEKNAVMCYDPSDGESYIIDVQADCLCSKDAVYVFNSNGAYRLEEGGAGLFCIDGINFGTGARKTVTKIFADCDGAEIVLGNGSAARKFEGAGTFRPRLRGVDFSVAVKTGVPVKQITLTAVECNEI